MMRTEKGEEAHPFDCCGGGVWDVISFALRCACLVLEQPANTRFLVLDEPFKFIHGLGDAQPCLADAPQHMQGFEHTGQWLCIRRTT